MGRGGEGREGERKGGRGAGEKGRGNRLPNVRDALTPLLSALLAEKFQ